MKILLTSGPTREPIDDVRYVSNVSTGRLGVAVANRFLAAGHQVVFLRGAGSLAPQPHPGLRVLEFTSTASLLETIAAELRGGMPPIEAWIHSAAVADYAPVKVEGKIKSDRESLVLEMRPTPKVADAIKREFPRIPLVMFKLESGITRAQLHESARKTLARVGAEAIVANLLEEVGPEAHRADLIRRDGSVESFTSRDAIGRGLIVEVERLLAVGSGTDRIGG
jgi:phosphopantothenoylcysteine synthetase/decarboxylase